MTRYASSSTGSALSLGAKRRSAATSPVWGGLPSVIAESTRRAIRITARLFGIGYEQSVLYTPAPIRSPEAGPPLCIFDLQNLGTLQIETL